MPTNSASTPPPSSSATAPRAEPAGEQRRPRSRRPTPTDDADARLGECAANRDGGSVAPSRTAAIGGTRVARRAGHDAGQQRDDRAQQRARR